MLCDIGDIGVFFHADFFVYSADLSPVVRIFKGCSPDTGVRNKTEGGACAHVPRKRVCEPCCLSIFGILSPVLQPAA